MTGRRDDDDVEADLETSPWATDEIVSAPAPRFEWDQPRPPEGDHEEAERGDDGHRRVWIGVGCVAALIVGAVVFWPRSNGPVDTAEEAEGPGTTLEALPPVDASSAPTSRLPAEPDDLLASAPDATDGDATTLELPDAVAAITEPTEIVVAADGEIVTLSLPSATVRRVQTSGSLDSGVVVAPDALAWFGGADLNIIPRIGPALTVDLSNNSNGGGYVRDWVTDETGSTQFLIDTFTESGNEQYIVDTDGEVAPFEPDRSRFDTFDFYGGLRSRSGDTIVNDAGGVYAIGSDDAVERLSTGQALASNEGFVLLRECDEGLDCGYIVLDRTNGERRPSPATTEQLGKSYGFDLAPDGTATLAYDFDGQERRLVDLVDGTIVAEVGLYFGPDNNTQWAADSSGVFGVNPNGTGLNFIDRVSGESVEFGDQFGRISGLGVRMPDAELDPLEAIVTTRTLEFSDTPSAPIGLDIAVLGRLGAMAFVDLDTGTSSTWSVPFIGGTNAPDLVSIDDEILVISAGGTDGYVSTFGETRPFELTDGAASPGFPRFPASSPDTVWSPLDTGADGVDHEIVTIGDTADSTKASGEVTLDNSELLGEDGTGRLVARVSGDVFVVDAVGTARLTDGDLLALGPNHALVRNCDDSLRCSVELIDRTSGATAPSGDWPPGLSDAISDAQSVREPGRSPRLSGTISPDGGAAFVRRSSAGDSVWLLVDFASGVAFDVPAPTFGQPILWNEDNSAAVYLSDDGVQVVERSMQRSLLLRGLGEVRAITAVDPSFAGNP